MWFGMERKKETLDEFFRSQLRRGSGNYRGGLRGYVGAVPAESGEVGAACRSSMTSSTSCSTPMTQWTRYGERSSFARAGRYAM